MARKRKATKDAAASSSPSTTGAAPRRIGLLAIDEVRRRMLLVDPKFALRYRQRDGE